MKIQQIRTRACLTFGFLLIGLASPVAARPRNVRAFVPPATKPLVHTFALEESVPLPAAEHPGINVVPETIARTAQDVDIEVRIGRARQHVRKGAELLNQGRVEEARIEFDRAVEGITSFSGGAQVGRVRAAFQQLTEEIHRLEVEAANQTDGTPAPVYDRSPIDDFAQLTFPIEPNLKGKVKEQLASTVSQLPLELADPVLGFINFFSSPRGRMVLESGLRRSGRYAPMIRRILDEEGLPQELIYLAQAESAFLPRAVSVKSATGMWQFMQWRGREYGLMQSPYYDDRLDPEKSTRAAARHLRDLYSQFGDWYLAVAAYNCGPLNVERAVQRTGYADFWELYSRNVLPRETANYLPIIIAMTIMAKNPQDYGLENIKFDSPLEYDTIKMTAPTHLALIADLTQRPLQEVREMNPALLKLIAPAGYEVHVAKGSGRTVLAALESVPAAHRAAWRVHRVGSNETVSSIARQYRIPEKSIADANGGRELEPQAGDFVMIPVAYPGVEIRPASLSRSRSSGAKTGRAGASRVASRQGQASGKTATRGKTGTAKGSRAAGSVQTAKKPVRPAPRAAAPVAQRGGGVYVAASLRAGVRAQ